MFEDIRYERSWILLVSLINPHTLTQTRFTKDEIKKKENLALEKLHRQKTLKEFVARQKIDWYFLFNKCPILIWMDVEIQNYQKQKSWLN